MAAFRHCKAVSQKVGLRLTLSAPNIADLDRILDFIEAADGDEALRIAQGIPMARHGTIEVRPELDIG